MNSYSWFPMYRLRTGAASVPNLATVRATTCLSQPIYAERVSLPFVNCVNNEEIQINARGKAGLLVLVLKKNRSKNVF